MLVVLLVLLRPWFLSLVLVAREQRLACRFARFLVRRLLLLVGAVGRGAAAVGVEAVVELVALFARGAGVVLGHGALLAQDGRAAAAVVSAVPEIGVAQKGLRYQALLRGVAGVGQVLI